VGELADKRFTCDVIQNHVQKLYAPECTNKSLIMAKCEQSIKWLQIYRLLRNPTIEIH